MTGAELVIDGGITATWSEQQLLDRATPELRVSVKPEESRALFDAVSQLGTLVEYQGAIGEANMAGSGSSVTASYVARAKFRDGIATIRIALVKHDGH